jgi:hypothetical protein
MMDTQEIMIPYLRESVNEYRLKCGTNHSNLDWDVSYCDELITYITRIFAMYYLMTPNAGISAHSDAHQYIWNATIYLNEIWNPDWGGLLLWDDGDDYFRGVVPKKNRMILFESNKYHLVTPLSPTAGELRVTIQLRELESQFTR